MANLATSLIEHERVITTPQKAKEARRFVERLITLAKKGGLAERRRALALLQHRTISAVSERGKTISVQAAKKLFEVIAPRFNERNGGYTRILRIGGSRKGDGPSELKYRLNDKRRNLRLTGSRLGDNAEQVIFEFVGSEAAIAVEAPDEKEE